MDQIPINEIHVSRARARKDMGTDAEMNELVASLDEYGLLQPIILDDRNDLVAGFRRYTAALILGWEEIPYVRKGELTELQFRLIELEENIRRKDMNWAEQSEAIAEIDRIRREQDPNWSGVQTAAMTGRTHASVSQHVKVAKALEKDPSLANRAKGLVSALREIKRDEALERRKEIIERKREGLGISIPAEIRVGDALDLIAEIPDESINAVVTNAPFGIDLQLGTKRLKPYEDDEDEITQLIISLCSEIYRVLKPGSWCVMFFDMWKLGASKYQKEIAKYVLNLLATKETRTEHEERILTSAYRSLGLIQWFYDAGFSYVQPMPSVWVKPNKNEGSLGDPEKGVIQAYEMFLFAAKGSARLIRRGLNNVYVYNTLDPSERETHLAMPEDLCSDILSRVVLGGEIVLDTFAGGGSFGKAALSRQVEFIGFELDPENALKGNVGLQEHIHAALKENEDE